MNNFIKWTIVLLLKTRKKHQPDGLKFQIKKLTNIFREAVKKNPDILRSGLGLGLGLLGQKITRINILSLPFKGVDIKLG